MKATINLVSKKRLGTIKHLGKLNDDQQGVVGRSVIRCLTSLCPPNNNYLTLDKFHYLLNNDLVDYVDKEIDASRRGETFYTLVAQARDDGNTEQAKALTKEYAQYKVEYHGRLANSASYVMAHLSDEIESALDDVNHPLQAVQITHGELTKDNEIMLTLSIEGKDVA